MYRTLAPKLRDNGWRSIIPIANPGKRALMLNWDACNRTAPEDREVDAWCFAYPNAGIGLAYGPDGVLGVDVDFLDPSVAAKASTIVNETLGPNDCVRIGQSPKRLLLYRAAAGLNVPGKAFGGYELFSSSGQTALYGVHPDTRQPYSWPCLSPEDIGPNDLPVATQAALDTMIHALAPLCGRIDHQQRGGIAAVDSGRVADWLRRFNVDGAAPAALCRAAVEAAPEGDRYPTAFSAVVALVRIGLSDDEIIMQVVEPYLARFDQRSLPRRRQAIMSGLQWARAQIGPDAETLAASLRTDAMFGRWQDRWRHRT